MAHPYTQDHECEPFQINKSLFAFHPGHRSSSCCSLRLRQIYANLPDASVFVSFFSLLLFLQIHIDIPRTNPLIPLFQQASVQEVRLPYSTTPPSPPTHSPPPCTHTTSASRVFPMQCQADPNSSINCWFKSQLISIMIKGRNRYEHVGC